ncbi:MULTISPECIES: DUF6642 family protein [Actinomycetes]|uniref:DUF6642 family protein n=1 Tax=Actinomycetes TaxID=1760 RepID=UPI0004C04865|nr:MULTISPECIES: DUF6642 family protein [Actinomycetes]
MTAVRKLPGVLCLEGEWNPEEPTSRMTIEPALELLERTEYLKVFHRNVNTLGELYFHLDRWGTKDFKEYQFLYLGFHGESEVIYIGDEPLGLDQLGRRLEGQWAGKIVFLSSCGALDSPEHSLKSFCKRTGADAVVGYTAVVDFVEAAAFELLLFGEMTVMSSPKRMYTKVTREYGELASRLGFRVATRSWASDL